MKILVDQAIPYGGECFSTIGAVDLFDAEELSPEDVRNADAMVVRAVTRIDAGLLDGGDIRFVASPTSGTDHVDLEYLKARDVGFAFAAGGNANSVAEYVVAALLYLATRHKVDLAGKSIGIIGVGHIGSWVAKKARALGMQVFLNDPPLRRATGDTCYLPLSSLYNCDFLTLHTPLTWEGIDKTYHLVDESFLDSLKPGVFLINTSRGGVASTQALKHALKNRHLAGAVLDVWEHEPDIDPELLDLVDIATPHIAGYSVEGRIRSVEIVYEALCRYFGIKEGCRMSDFLPEGGRLQIEIDPSTVEDQELLDSIVQAVYSIESDDANLRGVESLPVDERAAHFIQLRHEYPARREFAHADVTLQTSSPGVVDILPELGFQVVKQS
jgi:erythronate-4-phosphate dehydrogenase